jgi:hypothetical protein
MCLAGTSVITVLPTHMLAVLGADRRLSERRLHNLGLSGTFDLASTASASLSFSRLRLHKRYRST